MTLTFTFVIFLLIIVWTVRIFRRKLAINKDATRFVGILRGWKIEKVTGRVATEPRIHTTVRGGGGYSTANRTVPIHVSTDLHENIRLELLGGQMLDFELLNLNLSPAKGDVVTVCLASRRDTDEVFAALNHTTKQQVTDIAVLFTHMQFGGDIGFYVKFMAGFGFLIVCLVVGILSGLIFLIPIGCLPFLSMFLRGRVFKKFANNGIQPLWDATSTDAQALMRKSMAR